MRRVAPPTAALLVLACLLASTASARPARRPLVAWVDAPDRYTSVAGLATWAGTTRSVRAVDVTGALRRGRLALQRADVLVIGSFATSDRRLRAALERSAKVLARFVKRGGTLVVLAQAREDAASLDWLPPGLGARLGERDGAVARLADRDAPLIGRLFERPHALSAADLSLWEVAQPRVERASSLVAVDDAFDALEGFAVAAELEGSGGFPAIAIGVHGKGRVVLVQMPVDRVAAAGTTPAMRAAAGRLLENLTALRASGRPHRGGAPARPPAWRAPGPASFAGRVFRDDDGDGRPGPKEPALPGVDVHYAFATVPSDAEGRFGFEIDPRVPGFVSVTVPDGFRPTTPWYVDAWALPEEGRFGLQPVPRPVGPAVVAQVTDLHLGARPLVEGRAQLAEAVATVLAADPPVGLVIATGDLTASGAPLELAAYRDEMAALPMPVLHAMGNHDLTRGPDIGATYARAFGPWTYDVEVLGHRIVFVYQAPLADPGVQWARRRIAESELPVVLVVHHYPTARLLDALLTPNVRLVLSGDWHDGEARRLPGGAVDVNSAPTLMGGYDHSPPAVRFLRLDGVSGVTSSLRYVRMPEYLAPVLPLDGASPEGLRLLVQAYDSRAEVATVHYALDRADGVRVAEGDLARCGTWAFCGGLDGALAPGAYDVAYRAVASDGRAWHRARRVTLRSPAGGPPLAGPAKAAATATRDWPAFRGDAGRTGRARAALALPLSLAWSASAGGEVYAGGPVVSDGVVLLALMDRASVGAERAGVVAYDLGTGAERWRWRAGSSVRHSPVVADGKAIVQETGGTVTALALSDGAPVWTFELAADAPLSHGGLYVSCTPVVQNGHVYVGSSALPRVLALGTGERLGVAPALDSPAAVTYASPAAIPGGVVWPTLHKGLAALGSPRADGSVGVRWRVAKGAFSASPVVDGEVVFALSHEALLVVDAKRGRVRSRFAVPRGSSAAAPLVDERRVYVAASDGSLLALDRRSGKTVWSLRTGAALLDFLPYRIRGNGASSSPILAGDHVVFGGQDGVLYVVRRTSGAVEWRFDAGLPLTSAPAIAGGRLLVSDHGGTLYAFE